MPAPLSIAWAQLRPCNGSHWCCGRDRDRAVAARHAASRALAPSLEFPPPVAVVCDAMASLFAERPMWITVPLLAFLAARPLPELLSRAARAPAPKPLTRREPDVSAARWRHDPRLLLSSLPELRRSLPGRLRRGQLRSRRPRLDHEPQRCRDFARRGVPSGHLRPGDRARRHTGGVRDSPVPARHFASRSDSRALELAAFALPDGGALNRAR